VYIPPKTRKDVESKTTSENIDTRNNDESSVLDADLDASQALDEVSNEIEDIVPDSHPTVLLEPGELVETISDNIVSSPVSPTPGGEQSQSTPESKRQASKKKHKSKRKRGSDERTVQWLGDKV
jgi:hypothetical protein